MFGGGIYITKQKLKLYYVEGGDTLYKIAKRFGTTEQEIMKFNKPWFSGSSAGSKLWVPDNRIGTETSSVIDDKLIGEETVLKIKESDIESIEICPSKIVYMENSTPEYIKIKLKTTMPTRGDITVTGNSQITKIMLSEVLFKTEHLIFWAPMNDQKKQPLLPGEYTLNFNLYKQK